VGDQILQDIAELLRESIRQNEGWAARHGGDEFILCFPRVDNTSAKKIAERIRTALAEKEFGVSGHAIHVTCSFGVNTANPEEESSSQELLELADRNLYLSKGKGRNQVV
jgi:diguanylate cyclase (GGDEF)-like protein